MGTRTLSPEITPTFSLPRSDLGCSIRAYLPVHTSPVPSTWPLGWGGEKAAATSTSCNATKEEILDRGLAASPAERPIHQPLSTAWWCSCEGSLGEKKKTQPQQPCKTPRLRSRGTAGRRQGLGLGVDRNDRGIGACGGRGRKESHPSHPIRNCRAETSPRRPHPDGKQREPSITTCQLNTGGLTVARLPPGQPRGRAQKNGVP